MVTRAIACLTLISSLAIGMVGLDNFFARKEKLQLLAIRVDQKIWYDRLKESRSSLRWLEQNYGKDCKNGDEDAKEECEKAKADIKEAEDRINGIPAEVEKTY